MRAEFEGSVGGAGQKLGDCYVGQILTVWLSEPALRLGHLRGHGVTQTVPSEPRLQPLLTVQHPNKEVAEGLTTHYLTLLHSQERLSEAVAVMCALSSKPKAHLWAITQQKRSSAV